MKERSIEAMPPCFEKWCARFDDLFRTKPEKREFIPFTKKIALFEDGVPLQGDKPIQLDDEGLN